MLVWHWTQSSSANEINVYIDMTLRLLANDDDFVLAHEIVTHVNTRLNSTGDLHINHLDREFTFSDPAHGARAYRRLKELWNNAPEAIKVIP